MVVRVMVVDDDPVLIELFQAATNVYALCVVGTACDGKEALEIYPLLSPRPDIVIMDQRMPNMCGIECTKRLLQMDPAAKIVFVSAEHETRKEALSAGAVEFVEKPFAMSVLMGILMRVQEGVASTG